MILQAWPRGLIGRVMLVLLGAILLEFAASTLVYENAELLRADEDEARLLVDRLVIAERLVRGATPERREVVLDALSTPTLQIDWSATPPPALDGEAGRDPPRRFARLLRERPELTGRDLRFSGRDPDDRGRIVGALKMIEGGYLEFEAREAPFLSPAVVRGLLAAVIVAGAVLAAALALIHSLGAPFRNLTRMIDQIGGDRPVVAPETGSGDLRRLSRAFNAMQARLSRMIEDRTRAVAAISHDLRTPIARLKLRMGFIEDAELRQGLEEDVDEMEGLIESIVDYAGRDAEWEKPSLVDLASQLATQAETMADLGMKVAYEGPNHHLVRVRRVNIKRAVSNLVDNALKYGGAAHIRLVVEPRVTRIRIEDPGDGVPEAELARLAEPFYRIDSARGRDTRGAGLGLAIAKQAVEREGGRLTLANLAGGGFCAELALPSPEHG
jgi:signal transduction histidine kinase